jgi:hypothetical protein
VAECVNCRLLGNDGLAVRAWRGGRVILKDFIVGATLRRDGMVVDGVVGTGHVVVMNCGNVTTEHVFPESFSVWMHP